VQKKQKPQRTYWQTTLAILAALSASLALAEDFKTTNGKEYKDATIMRVEGDGIVLRSKTGISKIYFTELPKDVQEKVHYGQVLLYSRGRFSSADKARGEPGKLGLNNIRDAFRSQGFEIDRYDLTRDSPANDRN
jgi:hypothetical protein